MTTKTEAELKTLIGKQFRVTKKSTWPDASAAHFGQHAVGKVGECVGVDTDTSSYSQTDGWESLHLEFEDGTRDWFRTDCIEEVSVPAVKTEVELQALIGKTFKVTGRSLWPDKYMTYGARSTGKVGKCVAVCTDECKYGENKTGWESIKLKFFDGTTKTWAADGTWDWVRTDCIEEVKEAEVAVAEKLEFGAVLEGRETEKGRGGAHPEGYSDWGAVECEVVPVALGAPAVSDVPAIPATASPTTIEIPKNDAEMFVVGKSYKIAAPYDGHGNVYKCTEVLNASRSNATLEGRPTNKGNSAWCAVACEVVPAVSASTTPVTYEIPKNDNEKFVVGKSYKIARGYINEGKVFKCTRVLGTGSVGELNGDNRDWAAVECEVADTAPPLTFAAALNASALTKVTQELAEAKKHAANQELEINKLTQQTNARLKQIEDTQANAEVLKRQNDDLRKQVDYLKEQRGKDSEAVVQLTEKLANAEKNYHNHVKSHLEHIGKLEAGLEIEKNIVKKRTEENDSLHGRIKDQDMASLKLVAERNKQQKIAENLQAEKADLEETINRMTSQLLPLEQELDKVNAGKWAMLKRHELALLVTDRVTSTLANCVSTACQPNVTKSFSILVVALTMMLSWFAYLGKIG